MRVRMFLKFTFLPAAPSCTVFNLEDADADSTAIVYREKSTLAPGPKDAIFLPDGDVLVADSLNHRVITLSTSSPADPVVRTWGMEGSKEGQLRFPICLTAVGPRLYVLERGNRRVQVFR